MYHLFNIAQKQLYLAHLKSLQEGFVPKFEDSGFRVFSQNDEDGLLLYAFALSGGFKTKKCIDLACGFPIGSNSANLICNWGFEALLIDGNKTLIEKTSKFYAEHPDTFICPPLVINKWVRKIMSIKFFATKAFMERLICYLWILMV